MTIFVIICGYIEEEEQEEDSVLWSSCHDWAGIWSAKLHQRAVQNVDVVEEVNSCHQKAMQVN